MPGLESGEWYGPDQAHDPRRVVPAVVVVMQKDSVEPTIRLEKLNARAWAWQPEYGPGLTLRQLLIGRARGVQ